MFFKDSLQIRLETEEYRPGDLVQGGVELEISKSYPVKLLLFIGWQTFGKGDRVKSAPRELILFDGTLDAGHHSFPFEFEAPEGPFSFEGESLQIRWVVKARADIPWKLDPRAETHLALLPGPIKQEPTYKVAAPNAVTRLREDYTGAYLFFVGLVLVAFGFYAMDLKQGGAEFAWISFGVAAIALVAAWHEFETTKRLRDIKLEVTPKPARTDQPLDWALKLNPTSTIKVKLIRITFLGKAVTIRHPMGQRYPDVFTQEILNHVEELSITDPLYGSLNIPPVPSFYSKNAYIEWSIKLEIKPKFWADYGSTMDLIVMPPVIESPEPDKPETKAIGEGLSYTIDLSPKRPIEFAELRTPEESATTQGSQEDDSVW